jgi:transcriptional regulator with XRE-family HTH domain
VARLKAIPDGQIAETARRAGMKDTQLMRLRRGENTDIKLSTLERLARGLQTPVSQLLTDLETNSGVTVVSESREEYRVDRRLTRAHARAVKKLREVAEILEKSASTLPDEKEG